MLSLFSLQEKVIADYLTNPENQKALVSFAKSDDGKRLVSDFLKRPAGRDFIMQLVPLLLEHLGVPEDTKKIIMYAITETAK